MVNYPQFVSVWEDRLRASQHVSHWKLSDEELMNLEIRKEEETFAVSLNGGKEIFDFVVDSTGISRTIQKKVHSERQESDVMTAYVYGAQFPGYLDRDEIILIWDTLGGNSWINPSIYSDSESGPMIDIVYSAWGWKSNYDLFLRNANTRLQNLVQFASTQSGIHINSEVPTDTMYGMIHSHSRPKPDSDNLFPVGEAAGVAKPKTGESFNRTLLHGVHTAQTIHEGGSPMDVYNWTKGVWNGDDRFFTFVLTRLRKQLTNNHAHLIDRMGKWYQEGLVDQDFVKDMEEYIVKGNLNRRLLTRFITDTVFLSTVIETIINHGRRKIFGLGYFSDKWYLPKVEE